MLQSSLATELLQRHPDSRVAFEAFSQPAGRLVSGKVRRMKLQQDPQVSYYLYFPKRLRQPARFFVTVHGISRNAREHARRFAPYAEREGVILIAPVFKRAVFPGYQRLVANAEGVRPDDVIEQVVDEVRELSGLPQSRLYLFGFSGGGQFVHRYLMRHPERVAAAVIGAAGWYTFPDPELGYPRGLKSKRNPTLARNVGKFLQIPVTVLVGEQDIQRDPALNGSRRIDRQQGENRLERGRRWIDAMTGAARSLGYETDYRFRTLPGVGHDFTEAMDRGDLGERVFARLFGESVVEAFVKPTIDPTIHLTTAAGK